MASVGGCRSSFGFTADKIIYKGDGKLVSIHGLATGTDEAYVKLYDNNSAASNSNSNLIGVLAVGGTAPKSNEADMHGVLFRTGIYADVTHVSGTGSTFLVEIS